MRLKCSKAPSKYSEVNKLKSSDDKEAAKDSSDKKINTLKLESERLAKLKDELRKRSNFCSPNLMKPVYPVDVVVATKEIGQGVVSKGKTINEKTDK